MNVSKAILKHAALITETGDCLPGKDLYLADGKIAAICGEGNPIPGFEDAKVIDCSGRFVSPSFVNLHAHTAMNIFKGIAEDVTAEAWFNDMIWPYESKMTDDDVYVGTLLGIAEMLNNGVTCVADHYFGEEMVLRAAKESGIRMDIAPTLFGMSPDFPDRLAQVGAFIRDHRNDSDRIHLRLGPHSNYTCSEETLAVITEEAKRLQVPIHLHLSETQLQVTQSYERTGKSPFRVLYDAGGFEVPVLVAHGLWIEESDLPLLSKDTWFAFCPKTYMKLAAGRGGFFSFQEKLNYSFGTDGAASSNTVDPLEQARLFGLMEKFERNDATIHPAKELWQKLMAGHQVFGFGSGKMAEGAAADLIIWNLQTPDTMMHYDPVSTILYSANSQNVSAVIVAGEFLKKDGVLKMDVPALTKEALSLQRDLLSRGKGPAKVFY